MCIYSLGTDIARVHLPPALVKAKPIRKAFYVLSYFAPPNPFDTKQLNLVNSADTSKFIGKGESICGVYNADTRIGNLSEYLPPLTLDWDLSYGSKKGAGIQRLSTASASLTNVQETPPLRLSLRLPLIL